jgi:hypothetical protein
MPPDKTHLLDHFSQEESNPSESELMVEEILPPTAMNLGSCH